MVDLGFASQITLSHDYGGARPALPEAAAARPSHNPDGYCFIIRKVLPRLRELGVSEGRHHRYDRERPQALHGRGVRPLAGRLLRPLRRGQSRLRP